MKLKKRLKLSSKYSLSLALTGLLMLSPIQSLAVPIVPELNTPQALEDYLKSFIKQNFKDEVEDQQLNEAQLKGMFDSLDPYSSYFTKKEFEDFNQSLSGKFIGIGVQFEPYKGYVRVTKPISGGPAEKAGITSGDIISKVEGKSISGLDIDQVVALIKGEQGTVVNISVIKSSTNKEVNYKLTRTLIKLQLTESKYLQGGYGYVSLNEFDQGSASEVIDLIKKLENSKIQGLILDLRGNPGGSLYEAITLAEFFLEKDSEIMSIDYKTSEDEVIKDRNNGYKLPVVVLVDRNSASASEIVASALQKNKKAVVVGTTTYGKGTVQDVITLPDGDGFKLTVAEYRGPFQTKINGVGIKPDYTVELSDQSQAAEIEKLAPMVENKVYKANESGLNVYGAQQRLNIFGSALRLTSKMDNATINALKAYQKSAKLPVTGILDMATKKSLEEKSIQLYNRITSDNQLEKALEILKNQS